MKRLSLLTNVAILLLFITIISVFNYSVNKQLDSMYLVAGNMRKEIQGNIQNGVNALKYLNIVASDLAQNMDGIEFVYAPLVRSVDAKGNYALDDVFDKDTPVEDKINLTGYGGLKQDKETLQEMEMSLHLNKYFKAIMQQNKAYTWVYYYSNKNFMTVYPFIESKDYILSSKYKKEPLFTYALPDVNPNKDVFFTPLYVDGAGHGLMVTIGLPLYKNDTFIGITEIDITLKAQNELLQRFDYLNNSSVIINKEQKIVGSNNVGRFENKVSVINEILPDAIIESEDVGASLHLIDGKYVYIKRLPNAPWVFIYYKNQAGILYKAAIKTLPIIILIALVFYIKKLLKRIDKSTQTLEEYNKKIKEQANRDYLTNLYNRRYLTKIARQLISIAKREKKPLSVIVLDIDKFKNINDIYGHNVGDKIIKEFASLLIENTRDSDVVSRIGGEEFALLLPFTDKNGASRIAEILRRITEQKQTTVEDDQIIKFTISLGVNCVDVESDCDISEALNRADKALYIAKESGRNRMIVN